ncbi:MAG: hypothetical protein ACHQ49_11520 [Elusimicrobiota bacterium]
MTAAPDGRARRAALAVFAAALALRVGYVVRQGPPPPVAGDAIEYRAYADSLATTGRFEGLNGDRATRMPLYPALLAAVGSLAGPSTRAVQWTQCLLGALACVFVYYWGLALLRPRWALACGLAAAAYHDLIVPASWPLTEAVYGFLLAASFCALYRRELPLRRRALLGGLGLGLTYLVRPEVLPFSVLILGGAPLLLPGFTRRAAALALAVFLAAPALWIGRNALILGRFLPTTSVGNKVVYYGLSLPLEHLGHAPVYDAAANRPEFERDAEYRQAFQALRAATPWPRRATAYAFNLLTVYYPFLPRYDWTYGVLVPFWLLGLCFAVARRDLWPAAGLVAGLSVMFAFVAGPVSRYRFGFSPCLILLAGAGAQELYDRTRGSKRFQWGAGVWAAANVAAYFASAGLRQWALLLKACLWR